MWNGSKLAVAFIINLKNEKTSVYQLRKIVEAILTSDEFSRNVSRLSQEFMRCNPGEQCAKDVARLPDQRKIQVENYLHEEELIYSCWFHLPIRYYKERINFKTQH